jgi:hypothetical protein
MSATLRRTVLVSAAGLVGSVALAPPAPAVVVDSGSERESYTFVDDDFCGEGLRVKVRGTFQVRWRAVPHGPDGNVYYVAQTLTRNRFTNLDTKKYVDEVVRTMEKDHAIVVEEDTLLIEVLATGSAKVRDQNGKLVAANPGQIRFQLRVPHNGTPTDPSDDGEAEFVQITRESTGRNDDFCEKVVPALT